ncbi:uncharacterized protein [Amphiura filiformis]
MKQLHASFLKYGADVIETGTYQASVDGYMKYAGLSEQKAVSVIQNAAKIAQEAVEEFWVDYQSKIDGSAEQREELVFTDRSKPQIAASIACYGAWLANDSDYDGNYVDSMTTEELQAWHRKHIQILLDAGINLLAIETIPAQKEAEAIVQILPEFPGVKAFLTFSSKSETKTCHQESFAEAVASICKMSSPDQLLAVGLNCTRPQFITPLLRSAQGATGGRPFIVNPKGESSSGVLTEWTKLLPEWLDLGVRYIGGCCHTRPSDIEIIRKTVKSHAK